VRLLRQLSATSANEFIVEKKKNTNKKRTTRKNDLQTREFLFSHSNNNNSLLKTSKGKNKIVKPVAVLKRVNSTLTTTSDA
jgi:hypothetical protein